jgi:hypothetical protein
MKRSTREGKRSALNLAIHFDKDRVVVTKGQVPAKKLKPSEDGHEEANL